MSWSAADGSSNGLKARLASWAFQFILASLRRTPVRFAHRLALVYMRLLDLAVPRLRQTAYRNLGLALPGANARAITDGVYRSLARMLVAFSRFPHLNARNIHEWIRYEGHDHFVDAKRRGKGVLFATAHMGAWELSAFAHALMTEPMHVVVRPLDNPFIDAPVSTRRSASGNTLIPKKEAARSILRALKANEAVGVLIDQNAALDEGVFVDFFGIPACAGTAFVRMAQRTGAAVIPGFALWSEAEKRYVLRFYPILEFTGDIQRDTQMLHSQLEHVIREYPDQWLWLHRRWKTRPPGSGALY
jgi:Kdo2-lipid IVA lauroyltransferase/acyltransferase